MGYYSEHAIPPDSKAIALACGLPAISAPSPIPLHFGEHLIVKYSTASRNRASVEHSAFRGSGHDWLPAMRMDGILNKKSEPRDRLIKINSFQHSRYDTSSISGTESELMACLMPSVA